MSSSSSSGRYPFFQNTPAPSSPTFALQFSQNPSRFPNASPQWPQMHQNYSLFPDLLQSADHDALVASGNPTYAKLLSSHSELSIKHETLREAYLTIATSIPKIFHFIPNPLDVPIPSATDLRHDASREATQSPLSRYKQGASSFVQATNPSPTSLAPQFTPTVHPRLLSMTTQSTS
ncbi:hypothetical protein B0H13DRAFT_2360574 [Mycena leptocephala]|nr:hypothetical protein B0H13DRAFT_2360574 [Mycena leptocephala]